MKRINESRNWKFEANPVMEIQTTFDYLCTFTPSQIEARAEDLFQESKALE